MSDAVLLRTLSRSAINISPEARAQLLAIAADLPEAEQLNEKAELLRLLDTAITHGHTVKWQQERRDLVARLKRS